jgi:hypothetical protein
MIRTIECALGLSALLVLAGCYNTNNLKNGGLVCGAGGTCPAGYLCRNDGPVGSAGHCFKNGILLDAGSSRASVRDWRRNLRTVRNLQREPGDPRQHLRPDLSGRLSVQPPLCSE